MDSQPKGTTKPTIVLVHGAFETSDVWRPVEGQLRQSGYKTIAVTLPGRSGNPSPASAMSLGRYRDTVLSAIAHEAHPVVLAGHSFGGMTISAAAEADPERVKALVYVAAYLPADGQSLLALSKTDTDSRMGPAFRMSADKTAAFVDPTQAGELFCNGCSAQAQATFVAAMVFEPLGPLAEPVALTPQRYGRVPKAYVHTSNDRVVSPALQDSMVATTPVRQSTTLRTGHAAFVTLPAEVARAIERAAQ